MSRMRQRIKLSRGSDYMQMVVVVVKTMQRRKTGGVVLAGALKMSRVIKRIIAFLGKEAGLTAHLSPTVSETCGENCDKLVLYY